MSRNIVETIKKSLTDAELNFTEKKPEGKDIACFVVDLPGIKKLKTTVMINVSESRLRFEAFVCRKPDENFENVYKYLLKRNKKLYIVSYTLDNMGDIYLVGRISTDLFGEEDLDRILGQMLETADEDFNILLELGFASSIIKEWNWRVSRGESLKNLKAFEHLVNPQPNWLEKHLPDSE